jgi:hypothetical protein
MEVILTLAILCLQFGILVVVGANLVQSEIRLPVIYSHNLIYGIIPLMVWSVAPLTEHYNVFRGKNILRFLRPRSAQPKDKKKSGEGVSDVSETRYLGHFQLAIWFYIGSSALMLFHSWLYIWWSGLDTTSAITGDSTFFKSTLAMATLFAILNLTNFYNALSAHTMFL